MNRNEINKLIDQMKNDINNFNYSIENINKMENIMNTNSKYNKMILKVIIQNNNITYHNINGDTRKKHIITPFLVNIGTLYYLVFSSYLFIKSFACINKYLK
jgi:hypothetical protein